MENTYKIDITFDSVYVETNEKNEVVKKYNTITKKATIKEFSKQDPEQHDIFFNMFGLLVANEMEQIVGDPKKLKKIVILIIENLLITDSEFTEMDKKELLLDGFALLSLAQNLLYAKIIPFFLPFYENYLK